jgi:hypothetical protein
MDILESILRNRRRWKALEDESLQVVRRFLEFHHRAYTSGNFRIESALKYYLPEIYVYYTGRMYETVLAMSGGERSTLDPDGKIEEIRRIALDYLRDELVARTLNPSTRPRPSRCVAPLPDQGRRPATALEVLVKGSAKAAGTPVQGLRSETDAPPDPDHVGARWRRRCS